MDVARLGARLILQTALEGEVTEFLGRERYERGDRSRPGSRNGYSDVTVKTTAGPVTLARPKLRGTDEAFASRLLGKHVTRAGALESLTIAGYVRGLSTRDVEASLADALSARGIATRHDRTPQNSLDGLHFVGTRIWASDRPMRNRRPRKRPLPGPTPHRFATTAPMTDGTSVAGPPWQRIGKPTSTPRRGAIPSALWAQLLNPPPLHVDNDQDVSVTRCVWKPHVDP